MGMWSMTRAEVLRGKCPVTDGVPRSDAATVGFSKAYSKRFELALRMAKAERAQRAAKAATPPPPP